MLHFYSRILFCIKGRLTLRTYLTDVKDSHQKPLINTRGEKNRK